MDVTFTPFCKVVRQVLPTSDVHGIKASREQQWLWVYVSEIKALDITKVDKALKKAKIPGNPWFSSISMATSSDYKGLFVLKFRIY